MGLQADFSEFYGCANANVDLSIEHAVRAVDATQRLVDMSRLWFLKGPILSQKLRRPGMIFRSARERYKDAVVLATGDQKLALGVSYEMGYSMPSRSIHPSFGAPTRDAHRAVVDANIGKIGVLAIHVVVAAFTLSGIEPTGETRDTMNTFAELQSAKTFQAIHEADLEIGDIVAAYGDNVCEVIDKARTKYGYTSYKVRFLLRPMLEEIQTDWFPARYVHILIPRRQLRQSLGEAFKQLGISDDDVSDATISELLPDVLLEMEAACLLPRPIQQAMR